MRPSPVIKSGENSTFLLSFDMAPSTKMCSKSICLSLFVCLQRVVCNQNHAFFGFFSRNV